MKHNIFKTAGSLVWLIVSILLVAVMTVVTVLSCAVFYDLFNIYMPGGGVRAVYAEGVEPVYGMTYSDKRTVLAAARDFNEEMAGEGMVLLKNEENALPLATPVSDPSVSARPRISVFGKNSVNIAYGGSGSGGTDASAGNFVDLYTALTDAGYDCNPTLKSFYEDTTASGPVREGNSSDLDSGDTVILTTAETPQSMYTDAVKSSYAEYNDMALVVITRIGGEGFDMPRLMTRTDNDGNVTDVTGARAGKDDHFLQLDANEEDLIAAVCEAGFDRVVLAVNSGTALELGFLKKDSPYVTDKGYEIDPDKIDAAVWMGFPGMTGTNALASILSGELNPSGRLPDTYATDFKKDPTWENFGDNRITANSDKEILGGDQYTLGGYDGVQMYYFVDYEEGVYVGYKYYETRGATDGEEWYEDNVVYPFGYGLSYTKFTWTLEDASGINNVAISGSEKYTVQVRVRNDGNVAGKEVVQLYGHAPYTEGKIEKPEVALMDFAKTGLLQPGDEEVVTLTFDPYYLASYDYNDANDNGFKGYELNAGDYELYVSANAHDRSTAIPFRVASGIKYENDPVTGYKVQNLYTGCEDSRFDSATQLSDVTVDGETRKGLSRSDWTGTWPTTPTDDERTVDSAFITALEDTSHNNPINFAAVEMPYTEESNGLKLRDLLFDENGNRINTDEAGVPHISYDDERWEPLLNQCTAEEMINLYNYAAYQTRAIDSIGLPKTSDADGPVGWASFMDKTTFYDTCSYCCQSLIAATWSKSISYAFGEMVGNEGLVGNYRSDKMPYSGWYAPGANIHRSPFGGRNFEYYSEDALLSGKMAAEQIRGCQSKGVFCFIKHFAVNDQETHRSIGGVCSWVTEQSMREIYLRPFEMAVKESGTRAVMSSFNRIGTRWTGGDYRLITEILRNEWGFKGTVLCDFNTIPQYMNSRQMAYAGGDLNLAVQPVSWCDSSSKSDMYVLRQCVKNVCYTIGNSNAMNGEIIGYKMPIWQIVLIVVDCVIVAGIAVWGFFAIRRALKKNK